MSRERALRKKVRDQRRLMAKATVALEAQQANIELTQQRNDFWRNLLVASAFARGLGNERPISEVVEEAVPALMGLNKPMVPGQVPA